MFGVSNDQNPIRSYIYYSSKFVIISLIPLFLMHSDISTVIGFLNNSEYHHW
jgi:hypothetical protein